MEIQIPLGATAAPPGFGRPDRDAAVGHAHAAGEIGGAPGYSLARLFPVPPFQSRVPLVVPGPALLLSPPPVLHEEPFLHNPLPALLHKLFHRLIRHTPGNSGQHRTVGLYLQPQSPAGGVNHFHLNRALLPAIAPAQTYLFYHSLRPPFPFISPIYCLGPVFHPPAFPPAGQSGKPVPVTGCCPPPPFNRPPQCKQPPRPGIPAPAGTVARSRYTPSIPAAAASEDV